MPISSERLVKILNGEKTIEIRKSMPKCELPIDVYLFCSKGRQALYNKHFANGELNIYKAYFLDEYGYLKPPVLNGKVVAKFTLNKVDELEFYDFWEEQYYWKNTVYSATDLAKKTALDIDDIVDYGNSKPLYAWHIDNLIVFDKPMELREFSISPYTDWVEYRVRKAPKNWQYIYIEGDK